MKYFLNEKEISPQNLINSLSYETWFGSDGKDNIWDCVVLMEATPEALYFETHHLTLK